MPSEQLLPPGLGLPSPTSIQSPTGPKVAWVTMVLAVPGLQKHETWALT